MAKSKLAVGLDIGSASVKLVQLKEKKGGYQLLAFGTAPLPPEAIVDGALMNSAAIVQAIHRLLVIAFLLDREPPLSVRTAIPYDASHHDPARHRSTGSHSGAA